MSSQGISLGEKVHKHVTQFINWWVLLSELWTICTNQALKNNKIVSKVEFFTFMLRQHKNK